ncbi:hypothetical protein [Brevundimonas sp.]|uniref:hypothetical protein n=1 Tax=Brevundimonas sp. TaxID=1871086 RepID=UPI00289B418A|nr:hypothetical protein [Brevundimonas sp.]
MAVQPIYGWGWWTRSGEAFDVPEPFEFDASVLPCHAGAWVGLYHSDGRHPLSGLWIALSPRNGQDMNLLALRERPADTGIFDRAEVEGEVVGYAEAYDLTVLTKGK